MQPSFSGTFVTWAYFPQTTLPEGVTSPRSLTLTSRTVPLVITPRVVYIYEDGFFLTPRMSSCTVVWSSGCVTLAFLNRKPIGRIKRSYLGGLRVKPSPTNVTLVTMRFHAFFSRLPVLMTLNISSSATGLTLGTGTDHFPAFSLRFYFTVFERTFARAAPSRSRRYAGRASSALGSFFFFAFASFSECSAMLRTERQHGSSTYMVKS